MKHWKPKLSPGRFMTERNGSETQIAPPDNLDNVVCETLELMLQAATCKDSAEAVRLLRMLIRPRHGLAEFIFAGCAERLNGKGCPKGTPALGHHLTDIILKGTEAFADDTVREILDVFFVGHSTADNDAAGGVDQAQNPGTTL